MGPQEILTMWDLVELYGIYICSQLGVCVKCIVGKEGAKQAKYAQICGFLFLHFLHHQRGKVSQSKDLFFQL